MDNHTISFESGSGIGERLTFLRKKFFGPRGKKRFAADLGIPLSTYASYEAGRDPPPDVLVRAAKITHSSLDWLMTGNAQTSAPASNDPEVSDMLMRMEQILISQPKAKQAVEALLEVLSTRPGNPAPAAESTLADSNQTVIPILGRAAAGLPAFWLEQDEAPFQSFYRMIESFDPREMARQLPHPLIEPAPPYRTRGQVQIYQLAEPVEVHGLLIDGFLTTPNLNPKGKLVAVRIDGDSMVPTLWAGDLVIADTGVAAESGRIALLELVDGIGALCKLWFRLNEGVRISSVNRNYEPIKLKPEKIRWSFKVVGAVRGKRQ